MPQEPVAQEPPATEPAGGGPALAGPAAKSPEPAAPVEPGDLATLKTLAQPRRRQRMVEHLTPHGPATSATPARFFACPAPAPGHDTAHNRRESGPS
ncbi:hypothetical protein [Streptomyces sp. NPDC059894]|uniref:hypothetical protein n=1 Tax=unclassified Streptomyces TaxID=2593676 RepID=UPI00365FDCDF